MPKSTVTVQVDAPCEDVFALIHNYDIRLTWDTMLSEARILGEADAAATGVTTRCVGSWRSGWMPMETIYVNFKPGEVAAVKLTNRPPFFDHFAATIRHTPLEYGRSQVDYIYLFRSRPRWLAPLLEPIMNVALRWETNKRLLALKAYFK